MNTTIRMTALASVLLAGGASVVQAGTLQLGGGVIQDLDEREKPVIQVAMHYDPLENFWDIVPHSGILLAEEDTFYLNAGVSKSFNITGNWDLGLSWGAGYYHSNDDRMDLEYDLEFMTRIFLDYRLSEDQKVRLEFGHLSNASLGEDDNPGTEALMLNWMKLF